MRIVEDVSVIVRLPCDPDAINVVSFDESTESSSTSESLSQSESYIGFEVSRTSTTSEVDWSETAAFTTTSISSEGDWSETTAFTEGFASSTSH